jgi:hypothetical protein
MQRISLRKKNAKRTLPAYGAFVQHSYRPMIQTAGRLIDQRLPKSIHAVTPHGCALKVALFVVAYSLSCYNEF